ncbi:MAG: hypothetical protein OEU26_01050 [Candidatus Tectomicrobia bacterium]|nr:hypothetical protein [Candidatus Tectomicrobia bacterium]
MRKVFEESAHDFARGAQLRGDGAVGGLNRAAIFTMRAFPDRTKGKCVQVIPSEAVGIPAGV